MIFLEDTKERIKVEPEREIVFRDSRGKLIEEYGRRTWHESEYIEPRTEDRGLLLTKDEIQAGAMEAL